MTTRHVAAQTPTAIEASRWLFGWLPSIAFAQREYDLMRSMLGVLAKRGGRAFESDLAAALSDSNRDLPLLLRALVERDLVRRLAGRLAEYQLTDDGRRLLSSGKSNWPTAGQRASAHPNTRSKSAA